MKSNSSANSGPSVNSGPSASSGSSGGSGASGSHDLDKLRQQRRTVFRLVRELRELYAALPTDQDLRLWWERDSRRRGIPWDQFRFWAMDGWDKVRYRPGTGPLAELLAEADARPLPAAALRYEDPQLRRLVALCAALQRRAGATPFPLAADAVALELKLSQATISRWLRGLTLDRLLIVTKPPRPFRATEYRYLGDQPADPDTETF